MKYLHLVLVLVIAAALATSGCRKHHHHSTAASGSQGGGGSGGGGGGSLDNVAPAAVTDLSVTATTHNSATLTWTAPGDDGNVGQASTYHLRYATVPITNDADFAAATPVSGVAAPSPAGHPTFMVVNGLSPLTTYWFALMTEDEAHNMSPMSNVPHATTLNPPDTTPPANITDLAALNVSSVDVLLQWTAPGDDGTTGTASRYELRYSTSPIANLTDFAAATPFANPPIPSPPGETDLALIDGLTPGVMYYFAVIAADEVPNWSGLSNVVSVTTIIPDTTPPAAINDLAAGSPTFDSLTLTWTAPGDDGSIGTAVAYDVRFSLNPIVTDADFDMAPSAGVAPAPLVAGSAQNMVVSGLTPSTQYWFAIKTRDEVPNVSALSNVAVATTAPPPDTTAPAAIADLAVIAWTDTTLTLSWTAPGDDGLTGTAALYDIRCAQTPITTIAEYDAATHLNGAPAPLVAGSVQTFVANGFAPGSTWYFSIRTSDEVPNVSGLSNCPVGTTSAFPVVIAIPEVEPNNSTDTATPFGPGLTGYGDLDTLCDVDYWSFPATAGDIIRVELSGTRMTQATWDSSDSIPMMRIVDPSGNDMMRHNRALWRNGDHDLDIPMYRIPVTGTWFIRLQASNSNAERSYAVRVIFLNLGLAFEAEAPGSSGGNDTLATGELVTTPVLLHGWHVKGESDYFKFNATAGSLLSFEITAYRNGINDGDVEYCNPRLWLYEPGGKKVVKISASIFEDVEFTYRAHASGTWAIRVVEDGGSDGSGPYFLSINTVPCPAGVESEPNGSPASADALAYGDYVSGSVGVFDSDWFAFNGAAGDMIRIKVYDSVNDESANHKVGIYLYASDGTTELPGADPEGILNTFRAILRESGTHYIKVKGVAFASQYGIELTRHKAAAWEVEPNDTPATAMSLDSNRRGSGTIGSDGDVDVYQFSATASELASFAIYAHTADVPPGSDGDHQRSGYASTMHPKVTIRDSGGNIVGTAVRSLPHVSAESVTNPLPTLELVMVAPATGVYTITVEDQTIHGSATASYILERR